MPNAPSRIGADIRQTRPFRSASQEAAVALLRTASVVERHLARAVEPSGLSMAQYNVLRILRGAEPGGLLTMEVRDRMIEPAAGITRLLDKLEAAGHVQRHRFAGDRRQVRCRITRTGLRLLATIDGPMDAADDSALSMLTESELRDLVALLDRVRAGHAEPVGSAEP